MADINQESLYADIPKIVLDPRDDVTLLTQMYMRVLNASNGKLNKTTAGSALAALFEGIVYALATQRWYINNLPEAIAIEVFRFSGVKRSAGQFARGEVTVLLTNAIGGDFQMSTGTFIPVSTQQQTIGQRIGYLTTAPLTIPQGAIEGTVPVQATQLGSELNADPFGVVVTGQQIGLSYVNTIHNRSKITGGAGVEPMVDYIRRVQSDLRSNGTLVSVVDFENAVVGLTGGSTYAKAIPLMDANKLSPVPGNVSVFYIYNDFTQPSITECGAVRTNLLQQTLAGSYVNVFPLEFYPIQVDATVSVDQISSDLAQAVHDALYSYMAPGNFEPGTALKVEEVKYTIRSTSGVLSITNTNLEGKPFSIAMTNRWTIPKMSYLYLTQVDKYGTVQTFGVGYQPTQGVADIVD